MHFSKTYSQILEQLPPELRENAIQYRQLKKLINQVVSELLSLGLSPTVLHELITDSLPNEAADEAGSLVNEECRSAAPPKAIDRPRILYELREHSDRIEPHLKVWVEVPNGSNLSGCWDAAFGPEQEYVRDDGWVLADGGLKREVKPGTNVLWTLHQKLQANSLVNDESPGVSNLNSDGIPQISTEGAATSTGTHTQELIIPLISDTEFFKNLISALEGMSTHMVSVHNDFTKTLTQLSRAISQSALPASASRAFNPHSSVTSHAGSIMVSAKQPRKSDLYSWREIFQLYVETEIFEHVGEVDHGERSVDESEKRLKLFIEQATQRGLADPRKFKGKQSRQAWESFIELNLFILNIKKFSEASAEATRKILKKHTKRTALPLSFPFPKMTATSEISLPTIPSHLTIFSRLTTTTLPRTLVQAIGETLLPIIPHVDDYACLICTSIAFKPVRLNCSHLFCVRCLVKMQKRGQADCPLCRAPVVLIADKRNVDWALLNFMQDWFPVEAKVKLKANEREAAREQIEELGLDPDRICILM